jgi:AraC-like DNA-binding protein
MFSNALSQKVHVAELAAVAGISPNHFILRFARTFGMPQHRYLIKLRLDFAENACLRRAVHGGNAIPSNSRSRLALPSPYH